MTTTCAVKNHNSKRFKQTSQSYVMATQVNSSFLRTGNKKNTTSFLRCSEFYNGKKNTRRMQITTRPLKDNKSE